MNIKEQIAVMQHYANGGEVECIHKFHNDRWDTQEKPSWNWDVFFYRIKQQTLVDGDVYEFIFTDKKNNDICRIGTYVEAHNSFDCGDTYCHIEVCTEVKHYATADKNKGMFKDFIEDVQYAKDTGQLDPDEWIEWHGGRCPVDGDTMVEIMTRRNNAIQTGSAYNWDWGINSVASPGDIIKYRVIRSK